MAPKAIDICSHRVRTLVNSLSYKHNENRGTSEIDHFRTLDINKSHGLNSKSPVQELLNFSKTVVSVMF